MLALLATLVLSQTPQHRLFMQPNLPREAYAFFELAPASGAGMGSACACAAITGARGEAVTFTRASAAYCTREGLATTGLTTTSMVNCATNQIRVEAHSDGVLGILSERAGTNSVLHSEDITDGGWLLDGAPTRTVDTALTPWNTMTADTLDDASAGGFRGIYQTMTAAAGQYTCSVYLLGGTSTAPSFQVQDIGGGGGLVTVAPTLSTSTWSRPTATITTTLATTGYRVFLYPATPSAAVGTVFTAGFQCEPGPVATSYIPTTTAAVTRAKDVASATVPALTTNTASFAVSIEPLAQTSGAMLSFATALMVGTNVGILSYPSGSPRALASANTSTTFAAGLRRFYGFDNNTLVGVGYGSNTNTTAAGAAANRWSTTLYLGRDNGGDFQPNAIVSRFCVDPSERCR